MLDYVEKQEFPRTFKWHEVWVQAVIRPVPQTYQALLRDPKVTLNRGWMWVFITGFVTSAISVFWQVLAGGNALVAFVGPLRLTLSATGLSICAIIPLLSVVALAAVAVWSVGLHIIGDLLGGSGDYNDLAYLISSQFPLLGMVNASMIGAPVPGGLVNAIILIYSLGLQVSAVKTVHRFGWMEAIATLIIQFILIPGIILCWFLVSIATSFLGML